MGAKASKATTSSKRGEGKAMSSKVRNLSQSSSIVAAIKTNCMRNRNTKKNQKRAFRSEKKMVNDNTKVRKFTLEDWLLASPGPAGLNPDCLRGGELYVFKHFSRRVHPSCSSVAEEAVLSIPEDYYSLSSDFSSASGSSFSRSGKLKKKVSFRLPQETDIMIFYSPIDTIGNVHESF